MASEWKLVPVEPTEAMIDAARDHHEGEPYLPVSLYKAMLAAAPDVQGEPVEGLPAMMKIEHHSPGITIEKDFFGTVHIKLGDFDYIQIQYQYPHTDNARQLRHATLIADVLAGTSPQPAPDVAGLVEALECALETMENVDGANDCSRGIEAVEEALAAYHDKQEGKSKS